MTIPMFLGVMVLAVLLSFVAGVLWFFVGPIVAAHIILK